MDETKTRFTPNTEYMPPKMQRSLQQASGYLRGLQSKFDSSVWVPGKQRSKEFANVYPITATFLAIFGTLSVIPVVSYLAFVSFVLVSLVALALGAALGVAVFVAFWAGVFLFFILLITFTIAVTSTLALLGSFILYRLFFHLQSEDGQGLRGWTNETRDRLIPGSVQAYALDAKDRAGNYYNGVKADNVKLDVQ